MWRLCHGVSLVNRARWLLPCHPRALPASSAWGSARMLRWSNARAHFSLLIRGKFVAPTNRRQLFLHAAKSQPNYRGHQNRSCRCKCSFRPGLANPQCHQRRSPNQSALSLSLACSTAMSVTSPHIRRAFWQSLWLWSLNIRDVKHRSGTPPFWLAIDQNPIF